MNGLSWREEVDLGALNSLRLPARARVLAEAGDEDAIRETFARAAAAGLPVHVLGGGSNVVLAPRIEGVVLRLAARPLPEHPSEGALEVAAGCEWDGLVRRTAAAGLWGIENLALIPGSVGAAPVQNIGAYGQEFAEGCLAVRAFDRRSGRFEVLSAEACGFAYRDSRFRREAGRWLVTAVTLQLRARGRARLDYPSLRDALRGAAPETPEAMVALVSRVRRARLPDPLRTPNAGSFFKNPILNPGDWTRLRAHHGDCPGRPEGEGVKVPAAWLIERAGWRGRRVGAVGVSPTHALVLVHHGGGDGRDLLALAAAIREDVRGCFGVELEREPVLLGWEGAPA